MTCTGARNDAPRKQRKNLDKESHRTVEVQDHSKIVLKRRELKSTLDYTTKNALTNIDDRIVEAMRSRSPGASQSTIGAAILIPFETIIDERLSRKKVEAIVRNALGNIVVQ